MKSDSGINEMDATLLSSQNGRLTPIGGDAEQNEYQINDHHDESNEKRILLEEHERLSASLAALTRHFAHVQLRLQQVVSAPTTEDRETLLLELHEFASSGIPDVMCERSIMSHELTNEQWIEAEKSREKDFIQELKQKLDELEHYAAASGSLQGLPTSVMIEKQKILIDQLRAKLDLQLDDEAVSKLSAEELRKLVDQAIHQLTNPVKLKENLITQMRTQINDLEKFIEFLKTDSAASVSPPIDLNTSNTPSTNNKSRTSAESKTNQSMKKFLVLTQLYTFLLLTCGTRTMHRQTNAPTVQTKKDQLGQKHFGDLRAKLEIAIEKVLRTIEEESSIRPPNENEEIDEDFCDSDSVIRSVRHDLASALRALLEHGLYEISYSTTLAIWGCFSTRSASPQSNSSSETMHIWKFFIKYYEMKHGNDFINSPARKLSQSFSLDVIGGKPMTVKQCLLSAIDTVMKLHEKHTRPFDSCFKSFVCHALNEKKLVTFLRLILKTTPLVEHYYQPWSYTRQTGFNDALHSLDRLSSIDFHLPINLSIRRFLNNRDLIE